MCELVRNGTTNCEGSGINNLDWKLAKVRIARAVNCVKYRTTRIIKIAFCNRKWQDSRSKNTQEQVWFSVLLQKRTTKEKWATNEGPFAVSYFHYILVCPCFSRTNGSLYSNRSRVFSYKNSSSILSDIICDCAIFFFRIFWPLHST